MAMSRMRYSNEDRTHANCELRTGYCVVLENQFREGGGTRVGVALSRPLLLPPDWLAGLPKRKCSGRVVLFLRQLPHHRGAQFAIHSSQLAATTSARVE